MNPILKLCITICFARICDVSLGTMRTLFLVNGKKYLAATIGFIEVTIWFMVVKEALSTGTDSLFVVFAYSGGYALGNLLGSYLSTKVIKEKVKVQIVTTSREDLLVDKLRENNFAVTVIECLGRENSERYFLILEIDSSRLKKLEETTFQYDKNAFISITKTKDVVNGFFRIGK